MCRSPLLVALATTVILASTRKLSQKLAACDESLTAEYEWKQRVITLESQCKDAKESMVVLGQEAELLAQELDLYLLNNKAK